MYCDDRRIVPHRARGYERTPGGLVNAIGESMVVPFSSGGLCSSVLDLIRFRLALQSGKLIRKESFDLMTTPTVLADGWRTNYGFGLARYRLGRAGVIRHGGTISGFQANLMSVPEADLVIAALANTIGSDPVGISDAVASAILGLPLSRTDARPLPPEQIKRIVGRYRIGNFDLDLRNTDRGLIIAATGLPVSGRVDWLGGTTFTVRPPEVFGYYGSSVTIDIPLDRSVIDGFVLHSPFGEEIRGVRTEGRRLPR
jgi:CubicO group peptidase (beta-lactamase class C family)